VTLDVARAPCAPGEAEFRPDELLIAVWFGRPRRIEQVSDGRLWRGAVTRGEMHVLVPGEERLFRKKDPGEYVCASVSATFLSAHDACRRSLRPHHLLRDRPLLHIVEAVLAEAEIGPGSRLFRDAAAHAVVARLAALDGCGERPTERVLPGAVLARVVDVVRARLADDLSVDELAAIAGMSTSHFAILFRNTTGQPPHRFQLHLRVEEAQSMIERGVGVSEAALAVGFCDQSHLARHMRRLLGITPGAIARARGLATDHSHRHG
jgi:AraC family transcriptional regulator